MASAMSDAAFRENQAYMARLSIARTLLIALIGLTLVLAGVAGLSVASLYDARQTYEERLANSYATEVATANLLAAGVIEEAVLRNEGSTDDSRARARTTYEHAANALRVQAGSDRLAQALVDRQVQRQALARASARSMRTVETEEARRDLQSALREGRAAATQLVRLQFGRRAAAREQASDDSRRAIITAAIAGGLALLAALSLVSLLVAGLRRPLSGLVGATRKIAQGDLAARVEPAGPSELRELSTAFNSMASDLEIATARVEEGRRRLSTVIESLGDALVVCDPYGRIVEVNPRAEVLVPELGVGRSVATDPAPLPKLSDALDQEREITHRGRTLSVTAARLGPSSDDGVVWTIRDMTERARLEHAKSEFVSTASHELRSPLTSIKGFVELLGTSELSERQQEFLDIIALSTNRLVDLVNDLLDVARVEAGELKIQRRPISVGEAVREVVTLMQPRIDDKRQTLKVDVSPVLPVALADPARVRQIVTNLVTNAHLYTPDGGDIAVRVAPDGEQVVLAVADSGPGMTGEQLDRVFERFYRGGRDGMPGQSGSGLGLAIVKSLVDLHDGTIDIESEPGGGTTVTVRLPRAPSAADLTEPRLAIRGKRVLIVDDEVEVARLIAEQLQPHDVETDIVHSGAAAIERLRHQTYDAVTLDILLPDMDGFDVLREMRGDERLRRIPVVVVSVVTSDAALSGEWIVSKPIDSDELTDAVGSAILAGRARVLVVGRATMRDEVGQMLARRGIDYVWTTSGSEAARMCEERHFEVAMIDAGMRAPHAALEQLDLRGRRLRRAVVVFSTGEDSPGMARLDADPIPVEDATQAVVAALKATAEG